ncbi:MAG: hypothetical protein FWG79_09040 [Bacteroidales bacterium]|nr:hypothetical protein [Bacteroidales bacterium]
MKKITLISIIFTTFATKSFAYCPIPQWCPKADLHQVLCPGDTIETIEFPSVIAKTLIVTWWTDETRTNFMLTPPPGITVSGDASTPLGEREYAWPVSIKGAPTDIGTHHYTVSNTCGVELLHGSITLGAPTPATPGTITFSPASVCVGDTLTASINAVNDADFYTWTTPASMTDDGSDSTTLTITDAGTTTGSLAISVTATNICGTSAARTQNIFVGIAPTIGTVTPTISQTTTLNTAFASTLTVNPLPTGTPTPTIQWYSSTTATNSGGTSMGTTGGANTNTFAPPTNIANTPDSVYYYAVVTNSCGNATTVNTSGGHIVAPAGCDFVTPSRNLVAIASAKFATNQTWPVGDQIWSDAVISDQCAPRGGSYSGGTSPNFNVDCRAATNGFDGSYFSWCVVMKYANILCPGDWRVPTTGDFVALHQSLGYTVPAVGSSSTIIEDTYMGTTGVQNHGGDWGGSRFTLLVGAAVAETSTYWSSTLDSSGQYAYFLSYNASVVWPQDYGSKGLGRALRCVR